jgi:hypothetical protein
MAAVIPGCPNPPAMGAFRPSQPLRRHSPDADAGIFDQHDGTFFHRLSRLGNSDLQALPDMCLARRTQAQQ